MTFKDFLRKITSRKFIMSLIPLLSGVGMLFFGDNTMFSIITSTLLIGLPSIIYCIIEGKLDAEAIRNIIDTVDYAQKAIENSEKLQEDNNDNDESK